MSKPKKTPFPDKISPMLATLVKKPFTNPNWIYEIKWDGYRIIAYVHNGKAKLYSRGGQDYTSKYKDVADELSGLEDCVLDGEVVVFNDQGKPDFDALQNYQGNGDIAYYIFDLLYFEGESYLHRPLLQRKEMLLHVITKESILHYSDHFEDGIALFEQMQKLGLEGVIAKNKESLYQPGQRSKDWLKIKISKRQEFVIGGWTESDNSTLFKSVLFGLYEDGKLRYVHHAGGGFKHNERKELFEQLRATEIKKSPFINPQDVIVSTPIHWTKPNLVAEFEISTKETKNGFIRHPAIFVGIRQDKKPMEVQREVEVDEISPATSKKQKPNKPAKTSEDSNWPIIEKQKVDSGDTVKINGYNVEITNVEKELWKDVTKADLIQYYHSMWNYIAPYLENRPLSLHVKHVSPNAAGLYIKDMEGRQPEFAEIFTTRRKHKKKGKRDIIDYLVCNNLPTLIYIVNLGCIDINPWTSRITNYLHPDFVVIDLDPSDEDFKKVIETARAAKEFFAANKLTAFAKTSGKTGMHLCIPCQGLTFPHARLSAEHICEQIHALVPDITTTTVSINQRGDKLYVDPSQNDEADTIASPYSVRPFHRPTVSTPLEWKEVKPGLDPGKYNIHTIMDRLKKKGDLWKGLLDKKIAASNTRILTSIFL